MGVMKRLATRRQLGMPLPVPLHMIPREHPRGFQPGQAVEWIFEGEVFPATVETAGAEKVTIHARLSSGKTQRIVVARDQVHAVPLPQPLPEKPPKTEVLTHVKQETTPPVQALPEPTGGGARPEPGRAPDQGSVSGVPRRKAGRRPAARSSDRQLTLWE